MAIIKYKKGDSWVSIPMYVNTGGYITGSQIKKINGHSLVGEGNINITVDLSNYYTKSEVNGLIPSLNNYYNKSETYSQSEVNALINGVNAGDLGNYYTKEEIDLMIPSTEGFITETDLNDKGYLTEQSLANYYNKSEVDAKISSAGNFDSTQYYNKNAIDSMLGEYATLGDIPLDYLTDSDLSGYAKLTSIPTTTSLLRNDSGFITAIPDEYITETELQAALGGVSGGIISNNKYVAWNIDLIKNSAALDITLFSNDAIDAVDNYQGIVNALENVGSSIQMTGSGFDATLSVLYIQDTLTFGIIKGRILYGALTFLLSGKFIAKILTNNNDPILILVDRNSYLPADYLNITYSWLKAFVDNSVLVPGRKYAINDYTCIYRQPVTNIEMEVWESGENIRIICTATSSNTLSENVEYVRADGYVPIIECKYSIDPESKSWTAGMTSKSPKGVVWYMKDANGNECPYDFKHIKFRRWAINDVTANLKEHDGVSNGVSPYRVKAKSTSKIISDDRHRVGCGEASDEILVLSIVDGTWLGSTNDLTHVNGLSLPKFHSDYSKYYHKPFTDTSKPSLKYLAWSTTMNEDLTVSKYNGGLILYDIDINDYYDAYTFEYNGSDMSEEYINNIPQVVNASISIDNLQPPKALPNIVIQTAVDSSLATYPFIFGFTIEYGHSSTIMLFNYGIGAKPQLGKVKMHSFYRNIVIVREWNNSYLENGSMSDNYILGELSNCYFNNFYKNAIFGHINYCRMTGNFYTTLWYNSGKEVKYANRTYWEAALDGMYSGLNEFMGMLFSNILGPMQYCTVHPHHNTNTYRTLYNKGNIIGPNILHNSIGLLKYTKLDYKAIHLAKTGTIDACNINFEAFVGKDNYIRYINNKLYICGWNNSLRTQLPNMKKLSTSLLSGYYSEYESIDDKWHPYTDFTWDSSYSGNLHSRGILYVDSSKKLLMAAIANII